ncbi:MAG: hypothetical protein K0U72_08420 [Gammaproteobacteria bacterium]|nr:hypothetical protein [Gammaproteobacteria bacterium]
MRGSCHCENIRFDLRWPESEEEIPARKCACSFCQKHGAIWTSHTRATLSIDIAEASLVSNYEFGTTTANFHVCSACGVPAFVLSNINEALYAVVNVNALEIPEEFSLVVASTDFDGENTESRLERRKRNWIPTVTFDNART